MAIGTIAARIVASAAASAVLRRAAAPVVFAVLRKLAKRTDNLLDDELLDIVEGAYKTTPRK